MKNILKPESAENNKKASSFYDDYVQRTNQSLREAINKYRIPLPELKPTSKTYNGLLKEGKTSAITTKTFTPEQLKNTIFLDLKNHMN